MSKAEEIAAIERSIKEAKVCKDLGSALERLSKNRDFIAVVKQGYFKDEAVRLVHLRADPAYQTEVLQSSINKQIDAIGSLNQYFLVVAHLANQADRQIAQDEAMIEQINIEELSDE